MYSYKAQIILTKYHQTVRLEVICLEQCNWHHLQIRKKFGCTRFLKSTAQWIKPIDFEILDAAQG